jgi:branched-subunit amino acid ABC-type transport system permease component
MLVGIRPDRMQALAWGPAAGSAGIVGALMAFLPVVAVVGAVYKDAAVYALFVTLLRVRRRGLMGRAT